MILDSINGLLKAVLLQRRPAVRSNAPPSLPILKPICLNDSRARRVPARDVVKFDPAGTTMLYAPRGVGKTMLSLSIGLAVASGSGLLRWNAPRPRRVLYVDGEMPLVSLQERLRAISIGLDVGIPNDGFRILAADHTEDGISLGSDDGQNAIEPLLGDVDLLILDNLSTLCTTGSESASDAWVPMQNWLIKLRRQGISVLLIHHAGTNGRQRGTSRREDALDTVIALRRPEDYSPEQGARFEVHFEKLRNRVDSDGAVSFEAKLESFVAEGHEGVRWFAHDLSPPVFKQATELFQDELTVRAVAAVLHISKTEAGRMRLRALNEGLLGIRNGTDREGMNGHDAISLEAGGMVSTVQGRTDSLVAHSGLRGIETVNQDLHAEVLSLSRCL